MRGTHGKYGKIVAGRVRLGSLAALVLWRRAAARAANGAPPVAAAPAPAPVAAGVAPPETVVAPPAAPVVVSAPAVAPPGAETGAGAGPIPT